jgi:rhodanese-related sulfurtransferase
MKQTLVAALLATTTLACLAQQADSPAKPAEKPAPEADSGVPKSKQTTLGLYVTAAEAYAKWKADPEHVTILDVRTPEEYVFIGHAEPAWNIPWNLAAFAREGDGWKLAMKPNGEFLAEVQKRLKPEGTILVTCRSGGRSAAAVNRLAEAGYKNVYNILDGFEGDAVDDPESVFHGKRTKNGWRNAGLPWTYDVNPAKLVLPAGENRVPAK